MLCHNCQKREADKTFIVRFPHGQQEVHVCNECLEQMWQYAEMSGQKEAFAAMAGWWPGKEDPRENATNPFPQDAGLEMRAKRQMAALRARLEEAVLQERYEEAATLRDLISAKEPKREVSSSES